MSNHGLTIARSGHSRGAWRLQQHGQDVYMPQVLTRSDGTSMTYDGPVCGDTRAECIERVLDLVALQGQQIRHMRAKLKAATEGGAP